MTTNNRAHRASQRGASSVLVLLLLVVLVALGAMALTSSLSSQRLGEKSVSWSSDYYSLEALANQKVVEIDDLLLQAELFARDFVNARAFDEDVTLSADFGAGNLTQDDLAQIRSAWNTNRSGAQLATLMERVYRLRAQQLLTGWAADNDGQLDIGAPSALGAADGSVERAPMTLTCTLSTADVPGSACLTFRLTVQIPRYSLSETQDGVKGGRLDASARYDVTEWRQWQVPFDYQKGPTFWNGQLDDSTPPPVATGTGSLSKDEQDEFAAVEAAIEAATEAPVGTSTSTAVGD